MIFQQMIFTDNCEELAIFSHGSIDMKKANSSFSDGMKMKLMLAGVMARKTDLLLLDEPASPLDPLMRDKLCQMIGEYIHEGNGKRSVFFLYAQYLRYGKYHRLCHYNGKRTDCGAGLC